MGSVTSALQPLEVLNLRDHIAQRIRTAILDGTYRLGERLVESVIADQLGVSRAPVREALAALEQEGIVVQVPRRGYLIIDFTDKDIEEVYSLRLLLEIGAVRRAVERVAEEDLEEMQRLVDELGKAALRQGDPETVVDLDLSFHEQICLLADHSRLCSAWNSLRMLTQMLVGFTSRTHYDHPGQPRELHQSILDAIRAKDVTRAEELLKEHITDAQRRATIALREARQDSDSTL